MFTGKLLFCGVVGVSGPINIVISSPDIVFTKNIPLRALMCM